MEESMTKPYFLLLEEHALKRTSFLKSCLVGSFIKWVGSAEVAGAESCVDACFSGNKVTVNLVGLPVYLRYKKVEDLCGSIVNVICSLHDMSRVRIVVRKGGRVPVSIMVNDGGEIGCVKGGRLVEKGGSLPEVMEGAAVKARKKGSDDNF
ncbi:hypothetical protein HAX54_021366 [Datura stramonium]|uniref:Uncharacterized protein n=1 Tax=Datura stramonium TaxID=4076 RepID=A0ABS8S3W5_DATST|nr:hypothetical protein [Datura stramonium]